MKYFSTLILSLAIFWSFPVEASRIKMTNPEEKGYSEPVYTYEKKENPGQLYIVAIADKDNFPISSEKQGSIFYKIFDDIAEKTNIRIYPYFPKGDYDDFVRSFEQGKLDSSGYKEINGVWGFYYSNNKYSHNKDIYPAFFDNKVHMITNVQAVLDVENKEDLKKYRGLYVASERFSDYVLKDFNRLGLKKVDNHAKAYEELLVGKADYIMSGYYQSQIELYKLGIRDFVVYSKDPIWSMPMFLHVYPDIANNPKIENLQRYLKSARYKKIREEAFEELLNIYKESTKGVVPPTYIKTQEEIKNTTEEKAPVENNKVVPDNVLPLSESSEQ